jgi:hypothetical protein
VRTFQIDDPKRSISGKFHGDDPLVNRASVSLTS